MVMSHSGADHAKVIRYLDGFPLCSFNYLAYNDPALVVKQNRLRTGNALTQNQMLKVEMIKVQFNSKCKQFNHSAKAMLNYLALLSERMD